MPLFTVFDLTRPGIELSVTVSVAYTPSTHLLISFASNTICWQSSMLQIICLNTSMLCSPFDQSLCMRLNLGQNL